MSLVYASTTGETRYPIPHDPDEEKYYFIVWRPPIWEDSKEYLVDSAVIPSVPNGFYYVCINPGVSGLSEPVFGTKIKGVTSDESIRWKAVPYDLMLNTGDSIEESSWTGSAGVTISSPGKDEGVTFCKVTEVPSDNLFTLTNSVTILRAIGVTEKFDRTLEILIDTM